MESDLQHSANGGDGGEEINIVYLWHMHAGGDGEGYIVTRNKRNGKGRVARKEKGKEKKRQAWQIYT